MKKQNKISVIILVVVLGVSSMISLPFITETFPQSDAPYANCILYKDNGWNVILQMDEDCNGDQFSLAVSYYKANGYHEAGYSDFFGTKQMQLKSDKPLP